MTTKITKRIELAPGGVYEFTVKAPQQVTITAFDAEITLEPGDELHLVIAAPPHPLSKAAAMPLPKLETQAAA